jgi:hypothetical protein
MRQKAKLLLIAYSIGNNESGKALIRYRLCTREDAPANSLKNANLVGVKIARKNSFHQVYTSFGDKSIAIQNAVNSGFETITPQKLQGMTRGMKL